MGTSAREAAEGRYLKAEHIQASQNKEGVIISEGEYTEGKYGRKLEIKIQFNKVSKVWNLNPPSAKNLMEAWGEDTAEWVGKKVFFELQTVNGKDVIVGSAEKYISSLATTNASN